MNEEEESTFEFKAPTVSAEVKAGLFNAAGFVASATTTENKTDRTAGTWNKPQLSKKEKMQLKHEKFMSQLIMPGEKAKPAASSLSTLSSALKGMFAEYSSFIPHIPPVTTPFINDLDRTYTGVIS